jgi:hypothetical protein
LSLRLGSGRWLVLTASARRCSLTRDVRVGHDDGRC